ncbi:MAG: mannose-1-phosphate guanylyltransferase [Gemmatimonadaceae bacterium]
MPLPIQPSRPPRPTLVERGTGTGVATLPEQKTHQETRLHADAALWAVVLAGGIGSRFWPLSSSKRPKQVLSLAGERPLIADTILRLQPLIPAERVLVVTSADIAPAIEAAIPEVPRENLLIEPSPLGTAAALAWAAKVIARRAGPETMFCTLHADLAVMFPELFRYTLKAAARAASTEDALVTIGVRATRAEPSFGYILPGKASPADLASLGGAQRVQRFVEKPSLEGAQALIEGGALWNTGIFIWRAHVVLDALERFTPELPPAAMASLETNDHAGFAARVDRISIEHGLLTRSDHVVVLLGEFGWDDVGTWGSLRRARELDDDGNGGVGHALFVDSESNIAHAEGREMCTVLYGVDGLLVVALPGLTFVTTLEKATDLRPLLEQLPESLRVRDQGYGAHD